MFSLRHTVRTAGFTVPEMILVVAVMAILISVSVSPISQFMNQRDTQLERNTQNELQKALASCIENTRELPDDTINNNSADWYAKLSQYSSLSPQQIRFDAWGNERRYIMYKVPQSLLGTSVNIYYATIASAGPNGKASSKICANGSGAFTDNSALGGAINGYLISTDACWWKSTGTPTVITQAYSAFGSAIGNGSSTDDDILLKFSDYQAKMTKYQQTLDRLNKIGDALQSYGQQQYANAVASGVTNPTQLIYYPQSLTAGRLADDSGAQSDSEYATQVLADTQKFNNNNTSFDALSSTLTTRRTAMINLMRLLGLPDETCCSSLDTFADTSSGATVYEDVPFFYTSNPRPRVGNGCGTRPNPTSSATLPARVGTLDANNVQACY